MSTDRLTAAAIEAAVNQVLAGTPVTHAAAAIATHPTVLTDALEVYHQAGRQALNCFAPGWWQVYIRFTSWEEAERTFADHIAPLLRHAESDRVVTAWWFIRKHPSWRLRIHPGTPRRATFPPTWTFSSRPARSAETMMFGDDPGMDIAHTLFCGDSRNIITIYGGHEAILGRREMSVLLCSTLMRAAGLEWYEQADVWHRITQDRPLPGNIHHDNVNTLAAQLTPLLLAETTPDGPLLGTNGPLAKTAEWFEVFRRAGDNLGTAAREGRLSRGLRDVISYQTIFHLNRLGVPTRHQCILAAAAKTAILTVHETE